MASGPSDSAPVLGRIDALGRLVSADPELAALQAEAGSPVGAEVALPPIASIARLARKLGVPVSRHAVVAGAEQDIEMLVRATPEGEGVALSLGRWTVRPPAPPRLSSLIPRDRQIELGGLSAEWAADEQLRLISVSRILAERTGIDPADVAGQPLTRFFRLEEGEEGALPLLAGVAARTDFSGQRARLRGSDEAAVFILSGSAVHGWDGKFAGFRGQAICEDAAAGGSIAEMVEIDEALDDVLRAPLGRIIENADHMVQEPAASLRSEYAEYASDIAVAARHLLSVVGSMTPDKPLHQERVDLGGLAAEAAWMLRSAADARHVVIALERSEPLTAYGKPRSIRQIVLNLIGNAVRHSPEGGTVTISFEGSPESARVHVADRGPGIDPADQQRIFERFQRVQTGGGTLERVQTSEEGAGLGLAISRRLAREMGGDVTLESALGKGARFTLSLPLANGHPEYL